MAPWTQIQYYIVMILARLFAVYKALACSEYLVETVSDNRLTASSIFDVSFSADKARLLSTGWVPDPDTDKDPWIQVDFGQPVTIMAVVTKGFASKYINGYVMKYMLMYSNTSSSWSTVQYGTTNVFIGNSDPTTPVTNALSTPIAVRYLRLYPASFFNSEILRLDVIGCYGATDTSLTLNAQTTTTVLSSQPFSPISSTATSPNDSTTLNISTHVSSSSTSSTHTTTTMSLSSKSTPTTSYTPTSSTTSSAKTTTTLSPRSTQITNIVLSSRTTSTTSSKSTTTTAPTTTTTSKISNTENVTLASTLFNSSETELCTCACSTQTNVSMTPQEVQIKIENIVQNLTVSKEKTSKYIRSKISAQDTRPEVVYVGSVAVALLCLMVGLVVLPDVCSVIRFFYSMLNK